LNKFYFEGGWSRRIATRTIVYIPPGQYEEGSSIEPDKMSGYKELQQHEYEALLKFIRENEKGVLSTDRTEDLKVIHRLIDVLEKKGA
jgi:hypothetical protein